MQNSTNPKEVDDVLGGEEGWKNVDSTEGKLYTFFPLLYLKVSQHYLI